MSIAADPTRFDVRHSEVRGFRQAYVRTGRGIPLVCVHGWPESKRIFWRVIQPLADAGFDVIVPDLRGFGDSSVGPDGFGDVASHALDVHALVHDELGLDQVVLLGGDLGGPVIQDLSLRFADWVDRMVLFNSPLAYDKATMAGLNSRPPAEAADYFLRQGTDPDGLAADLATPEQRRRYIATFYTSRFWGHPGAFDALDVDFHTDPFGDGEKLRASFEGYASVFDPARLSCPTAMASPNPTPTCILFGASDHVIYPDFDRMAAAAFPTHVGPFLLRDCGHFVPWERPHALVSATRSFCADRLARAPWS